MHIKYILSDLDGVIRKFPYERDEAIEERLGFSRGALYKTAFEKSLLSRAVLGQITDDVWREEITAQLAKNYGQEKAAAAVQEWGDFPGLVDEEYLGFLVHRFPHTPIVVLTNGTSRLKDDLAKLGLEKRFHRVFSSSEIGVSKPDKKIFQHVVEKLGCKPGEVLFIDDSLSHIESAQELGMHVHHYRSLAELKNELRA